VSDRPASSVEVRRAGERFHTATPGVESWHSFSFGAHYDPTNLGFGALLAHNDETLAPGAGFDPHPHRDVEIVTYVVSGSLTYSDDAGRTGVARPGLVQLVRAGSGIVHAERNASATEPVRFIQLWVAPDVRGKSSPVTESAGWLHSSLDCRSPASLRASRSTCRRPDLCTCSW
jgi:redox-sensitive bicupin YhaK (pirin superfamily)